MTTRRTFLSSALQTASCLVLPTLLRAFPMIAASWKERKKFATVRGTKIAYIEENADAPKSTPTFVFLHGNPTSSYLWRNIIPYCAPFGRCIAPDLAGMGDSDKLPASVQDRYTIASHAAYLEEFLEEIGVKENVVLVVHDWGGVLGFDWARRHGSAVRGIAFMETFVWTLTTDRAPKFALEWFRNYRTEQMEKAVLQKNQFVEYVLLRDELNLTEADKTEYRRPFLDAGESRLPTLTFPRQVPLDGDPKDVYERMESAFAWMKTSDIPKLFINAEPGALIQQGVKQIPRS